MELGIVRVRVGLSYDPLRLSPSSGDLWKQIMHALYVRALPPNPTKTQQHPKQQQQQQQKDHHSPTTHDNNMTPTTTTQHILMKKHA